jgi:Eukaryotic porin
VQVTADYAQPYITSKASMILAKSPVLDVSGATGYNGFVLGGTTMVDAANSKVSGTKLAAAYMGKDFVMSAHTDGSFKAVKGTYWQQLDAASSIAAEVTHQLGSEAKDVGLVMGYAHVSYTGARRATPHTPAAASCSRCGPCRWCTQAGPAMMHLRSGAGVCMLRRPLVCKQAGS